MGSYATYLLCECGQRHAISGDLRIPDGPDQEGTAAELYPSGELPSELVEQLNDKVWCNQAQDYVLIGDPARLLVRHGPRWYD